MKTITLNFAPYYGFPARTQIFEIPEPEFSQEFIIDDLCKFKIEIFIKDGSVVKISNSHLHADGNGGGSFYFRAKIENNKINWNTIDNKNYSFPFHIRKQADICFAELLKVKAFI